MWSTFIYILPTFLPSVIWLVDNRYKWKKKRVTVGERGGSKRIDWPDSWRGDCWDGLQRSPAELRGTAGEGAAEGWRLRRPCVWSPPSRLGHRRYPRLGSSRGVPQECYPTWQLSDSLSSLLICLVCLLFMCQCCVTKHSTWTYPKSLYVEKTGEWDLICIDTAWRFSVFPSTVKTCLRWCLKHTGVSARCVCVSEGKCGSKPNLLLQPVQFFIVPLGEIRQHPMKLCLTVFDGQLSLCLN